MLQMSGSIPSPAPSQRSTTGACCRPHTTVTAICPPLVSHGVRLGGPTVDAVPLHVIPGESVALDGGRLDQDDTAGSRRYLGEQIAVHVGDVTNGREIDVAPDAHGRRRRRRRRRWC